MTEIDGRLRGKIALITGGSSGIGLASASAFAAEGASVVITGRDQTRLDAACRSIGNDAQAIQIDLNGETGARELAGEIRRRSLRLDVLFANAGASNAPPLFETTDATFDETIGSNLKGPFFTVIRLFDLLERGASVILTSSVGAHRGSIGDPLYTAAKAGVRSLARGFAAQDEFLQRSIRVNALSFGAVTTPMTGAGTPELREAFDGWARDNVPVKRWASAQEAARAALFLATDDSTYMTGSELAFDGGLAQL